MSRTCRFHWSPSVVLITVVCLLFMAGGIWIVAIQQIPEWWGILFKSAVIGGIIFALGYCVTLIPLELKWSASGIRITRLFSSTVIPIREVRLVKRFPSACVQSSVRTCGSGGLFGFLGHFKNEEVGRYVMYATELDNLVMVRTSGKTYVFSCVKREEFISEIRGYLANKV